MQIAVLKSPLASLPLAGAFQPAPAGTSLRGTCGRLCSECDSCSSLNQLDELDESDTQYATSDLLQD